jgi:ATP/maltotriose-dependent transcriptional regulator MalT
LPHLHTLTRVRQFVNGRMTLVGSSIKSHVNRILSKLNLRDRAQAIVVAY